MAAIDPIRTQYRDPMVHDLHARVGRLESAMVDLSTKTNAQTTDLAVMKTDLTYVKENVAGIRSGINKILWAIALSVVAAATTFVLSGGLVIVQQ